MRRAIWFLYILLGVVYLIARALGLAG